MRLFLQFAVERRLGEKSACRLQNLVGPAQFAVLLLQRLETLALLGGHAGSNTTVDFRSLNPSQQSRWRATDLRCNRLDSRPQRPILIAVLLHQTHRTFTYFRGKLVVLAHGSILSRNEASSKPGAIQIAFTFWVIPLAYSDVESCTSRKLCKLL